MRVGWGLFLVTDQKRGHWLWQVKIIYEYLREWSYIECLVHKGGLSLVKVEKWGKNIVRFLNSERMRWLSHIIRKEESRMRKFIFNLRKSWLQEGEKGDQAGWPSGKNIVTMGIRSVTERAAEACWRRPRLILDCSAKYRRKILFYVFTWVYLFYLLKCC